MSEFKIDIRKVIEIKEHPNAEKLEIVVVDGLYYTIISAKGNFKIDDFAFVFQSDSVFPPEMIEYFGLGYLYKGNRVKEVKLRGVISQALLLPLNEVNEYAKAKNNEMLEKKIFHYLSIYKDVPALAMTIDFSEELGIIKYEIPENFAAGQAKGNLPIGVEKYDLENAERNPFYFEELFDKEVIISEKLEGINFAIHLDIDGEVHVCSRNLDLKESESKYWEAAHNLGLVHRMEFIRDLIKEFGGYEENLPLTLRGELIGQNIKENIYQLNHQTVYFFDIKYGANYANFEVFRRVIEALGLNIAPVIFRGVLSDFSATFEDLKARSNGVSVLHNILREGIVIRPVKEIIAKQGFTRLIFKQRSPEYLANQK